MPLSERLRSFLASRSVSYTLTRHPLAFTAREVALAEHLPVREVAKVVVIFGDGAYQMILVPANKLVDLQEARLALGLYQIRLATEEELARLFPDCEIGAMPPFGGLYGIPVCMDTCLNAEPTVAFNCGSHFEVLHMKTTDFRDLVHPTMVSISRQLVSAHGW